MKIYIKNIISNYYVFIFHFHYCTMVLLALKIAH